MSVRWMFAVLFGLTLVLGCPDPQGDDDDDTTAEGDDDDSTGDDDTTAATPVAAGLMGGGCRCGVGQGTNGTAHGVSIAGLLLLVGGLRRRLR